MTKLHAGTLTAALAAILGLAALPQASSQAPALPDSVSIESNIHYDRYPETVLDILQPKAVSKEKRPGVIVIHGGGWVEGTKEERVLEMMPYLQMGFAAVNVEYRLGRISLAPAAVQRFV